MKSTTRIDYLDGIRGLAALAVTVLHAWQMFGVLEPMETRGLLVGFEQTAKILHDYGIKWAIYAVEVFIVLSGYSLMLGVAKSADGTLKGGLRGYFQRRIQRIWPPYFWSIAISLFLIVFVTGMNVERGRFWDLALPALTPGSIVSHLFFFQNLNWDWVSTINPPLWTIAVEEQIYILFPLLLLPLWRKFGTGAMIAAGLVLSIVPFLIIGTPFEVTHLWYLALFALGAAAASVNFSTRPREMRLRTCVPWAWVGIISLILWLGVKVASEVGYIAVMTLSSRWLEDIWFGAGIACLLIHWTERSKQEKPLPQFAALRLFTAKPVMELGTFTYSLYLMHAPILAVLALVADGFALGGLRAYAYIVFVGVPASIIGSYIFYLLVERPFMPQFAYMSKKAAVVRWIDSLRAQLTAWLPLNSKKEAILSA